MNDCRARSLSVGGENVVIWSFVYLGICGVMELLLVLFGCREAKEVEILILGHELEVLGRQHPRPRVPLTASIGAKRGGETGSG